MQRICKTCKREIFNSPSNFCSTTCLQTFTTARREAFYKSIESAKKLQPVVNFYNVHKKDWEKRPKELSDTQVDDIKTAIKTLYDPMENEYN